jgi:hypothetical protein
MAPQTPPGSVVDTPPLLCAWPTPLPAWPTPLPACPTPLPACRTPRLPGSNGTPTLPGANHTSPGRRGCLVW